MYVYIPISRLGEKLWLLLLLLLCGGFFMVTGKAYFRSPACSSTVAPVSPSTTTYYCCVRQVRPPDWDLHNTLKIEKRLQVVPEVIIVFVHFPVNTYMIWRYFPRSFTVAWELLESAQHISKAAS